jgi:hypothetical protein
MSARELAMLRHPDGSPVPRTAGQASLLEFQRALAATGGQRPTDAQGRPMGYVPGAGWKPRDWRLTSTQGRRVADAARELARVLEPDVRLARLERGLLDARRQDRIRDEATARRVDQAGIELYARASDRALEFLRMYQAGRARPLQVSLDEAVGCQLATHFPSYVPLAAEAARRERQS